MGLIITPDMARLHPTAWAMYASEGRWQRSYHLQVLAEYLWKVHTGEIKRLAISFPPRHGKALSVSTPVYTQNRGWVQHGNLEVGDIVFDTKGCPVRVEAVGPHHVGPAMRVTFNDGSMIFAHENHEWDVLIDRDCKRQECLSKGLRRGHRHEERRETKNLLSGYHRRAPQVPVCEELELPPANLPIDPYLLGAWLGDGHNDMSYIFAHEDDRSPLAEFTHSATWVTETTTRLHIKGLKTQLRAIGLLRNKHIPREYLHASADQRLSLLQGLMDTDGSISERGQAEFCNTNYTLVAGVEWLVRSLGMNCSLIKDRARLNGKDCGPRYRVLFTPNANRPVFRLDRKRSRQVSVGSQATMRTIVSVEPVGNDMVNCIQVEGGVYLAGRRLIPTHNSEFVTKYFASWWLGTHPEDEVIISSYAQRLTEQWSVAARDLLVGYGKDVFGHTTGGRANKAMWTLKDARTGRKKRGSMFATGKGGAMTGRGADLLICDDLIRDHEEASNPAQRDKCWEWLQSVAFTRLSPKGRAIIIGTRWHYDDPIGRLERMAGTDDEGEPWHFVNFPAIAVNDNDVLGRKKGEALWPERFPPDHLGKIKNQVGPYVWEALYQGSPTPSEGGFFKKDWFRYFREEKGRIVPTAEAKGASSDNTAIKAQALKTFCTVDLAISTKESADYTCAAVWGIDMVNKRLLLLDMHRVRLEGPDIVPLLRRLHAKHKFVGIYVETVAFQLSIVQEAMREGLPVRRLTPDRDKVSRAIPATCVMEQGKVFFAEDARWLPALETEILQFPHGVHDDQVDCLAYAAQIFLDVMQAARQKKADPKRNASLDALKNRLSGIW